MRLHILSFAAVFLSTFASGQAQANRPLSRANIRTLASSCARKVHPDTVEAISKQESAFYPYALSINYPKTEAKGMGYAHAEYQLARQPKSEKEAIAWMKWFLSHGHSVSIGLMQVSTQQARQLGIKDPAALFEPCLNMAAGAVILQESYRGQSPTLSGLASTFALYNSGSQTLGRENGYASGVIQKAPPLTMIPDPAFSPLHSR